MKIGIDAHAIGTRAGGNETYMRELLAALATANGDHDFLGLITAAGVASPGGRVAVKQMLRTPGAIRVPLLLPWLAGANGCDLLHCQYVVPPWSPCPTVVSIHDVGWLRFPALFPSAMRRRLAWLTPGTLQRASRIFVLTNAIRQEIEHSYGISKDRIDVVSPSVDPRFFSSASEDEPRNIRSTYGLPEKFVLYVGALQPRKNLVRLSQAFSRLRDQGLPHALVIAGERAWLHHDMVREIESLGLGERLIFTGYVDSGDLPCLLRAADAFAYVSLYEGFGLPALEALASGVPTVISTDPAIMEVCGSAAVPCDPTDVDDMERALVSTLTDLSLRTRLIHDGPSQAQRYTRSAMAAAAIHGYRQALVKP